MTIPFVNNVMSHYNTENRCNSKSKINNRCTYGDVKKDCRILSRGREFIKRYELMISSQEKYKR